MSVVSREEREEREERPLIYNVPESVILGEMSMDMAGAAWHSMVAFKRSLFLVAVAATSSPLSPSSKQASSIMSTTAKPQPKP